MKALVLLDVEEGFDKKANHNSLQDILNTRLNDLGVYVDDIRSADDSIKYIINDSKLLSVN